MEYELALPIISVFLLFFDLFQLSRSKRKRNLNSGFYASFGALILVLLAYFLLLRGYIANDFSLAEVYTYSSSSLPLISKISASWAGAAGSILFLTLMIVSTYFGYRFLNRNNPKPLTIAASQILCILAIFFVFMDIGKSPFARLAVIPPDGAGLNPALQTPWMQVHPPIVFAGYAFVLLAFAVSLAGMKTREIGENKVLSLSMEIAWLLMTIGIALGGLWAYEVLGWGGYWSWDPVETGSLLVWLAITAYFFIRPLARNGKTLAGQFTILVTFMALIFLSALTRGGLLRSVHAYALSPAGPILIGLAVGFAGYFYYLKRKIALPLFKLNFDRSSVRSTSLIAGYVAIAALFLGSFLGVAVPILEQLFTSDPLTPNSAYYNTWSFPFAALLIVTMIGFAFHDRISIKKLIGLIVGCAVVGFALVAVGWPTSDFLANLGIPFLALGFVCVTYDLAKTASKSQRAWISFGRKLLFFGMILGLFGILLSAATKQSESFSNIQFNSDGVATIQALDLSIVLRNCTTCSGEGKVYSSELDMAAPEYSSMKVEVDIYRGQETFKSTLWENLYTNYGIIALPAVVHTFQGDIYLHLGATSEAYNSLLNGLMGIQSNSPPTLMLTVSSEPYVYLLWIGVALMCLGIFAMLIGETRRQYGQHVENPSIVF